VQVSEGIHRLTQGVTNFYLIGESGKYTVVDAGTPGDWAYFARSLAGLGAKLADVDAVLLTHAHPDHTGFAERARTEAGAQVWIHRADEQAARTGQTGKRDGKVTSYLLRAAFYRTTLSLLRRGGGRMIPIAEVSAFGDGEQIDVPGRPRAVLAPGHTPGSAALLFEDRAHRPDRPADHAGRAERGRRPGARLAGRAAGHRGGPAPARARRSVDPGRGRGRSASPGGGPVLAPGHQVLTFSAAGGRHGVSIDLQVGYRARTGSGGFTGRIR